MSLTVNGRQPRGVLARTLLFGASALVAAGLLTWSPATTSGWNQGSAESTLWQLLNGARVNNGLAPLQQHSTLVSLARWRSADMLNKNYFSHTIAGCGCLVYAYYDSHGLSYVWGGENIGWNSGLDDSYSPIRVHERFMASSGHRANVLNGAFTHGGVGAAAADNKLFLGHVQNTRMYTELFLQAHAAAPAPRPPSPPAPAPRPPSGGGGAAPAAPRAQPAPEPEPEPMRVEVQAPRRPQSTAGLDGRSTLVSSPARPDLATHLLLDEVARSREAGMRALAGSVTGKAAADAPPMEVSAPPAAEPGPLESIFSAIFGFLSG